VTTIDRFHHTCLLASISTEQFDHISPQPLNGIKVTLDNPLKLMLTDIQKQSHAGACAQDKTTKRYWQICDFAPNHSQMHADVNILSLNQA